MIEPEFERAGAEDLQGILSLQNRNLLANVADACRNDGFLSLRWSPDQIEAARRDLAVMICRRGAAVIGYMIATTSEFNLRFRLFETMRELYPVTSFGERKLSEYRSFVYGPVCIEREFRGTGILEGLFFALVTELSVSYEIGVAFIDSTNQRSLQAHIRKLGMQPVGRFLYDGKEFELLAFDLRSSVLDRRAGLSEES